jgi:hypothetical protein
MTDDTLVVEKPSRHDTLAVEKALRSLRAGFPQVVRVRNRIRKLIDYPWSGEEPTHLMLLGQPGTGKSTLLKWIAEQYPRVSHANFTEIPVLYASVPANCRIGKLAGAMLRAMGSPFWNRGDEGERTHQLMVLLKQCKVRAVILDEVNHLVDRGQHKTHELIADWIKQLSSDAAIPFILAGVPRSRELLAANDQLADRFREEIELQPFGLENTKRSNEFATVMRTFSKVLGSIEHVSLHSPSMLKRLVFATNGRLRVIRNLLVAAVDLMAEDQGKRIDLATLENAFLSRIFKGAKPEQNPFGKKFRGTPLVKAGEPFAPSSR